MGETNNERGKRFHLEVKETKNQYQRNITEAMMANF